jgi:amino acid transporter
VIGTRAPASQTTPGGDATERDIPAATSIISSVALTFFAFLGFAVVAFSAADMENPRRDLPRAMYLSLIITTVLYVAIALGVYGMLPLDEVIASGDTAIAAAAEPILGTAGFVIMTLAASISTSSAVNSQFFAISGVVGYLAKIGQMPPVFGHQAGKNGTVGTVISAVLVSILALLFDLSAIASIGSAVALMIFGMVGVAHLRLVTETGAKRSIIYLSIISVVITLLVFAVETLSQEPETALALVAFVALSVVMDRFWRAIPYLRGDATITVPPAVDG